MGRVKICNNFNEAVAGITDGASIMIGSFGRKGGMPCNLILALQRLGVKNLTLITNHAGHGWERTKLLSPPDGYPDHGILFESGQVRKLIASFPVSTAAGHLPPSPFEKQYEAGEVELEIYPQGTFAEKIRAGGGGLGGFYTPTGVGTIIEQGKEKRVINGKEYILELPLTADFALLKGYKADKAGNVVYRGTSRSFAPLMATATKVTIFEVNGIVEVGELDPEVVVTPGIYVNHIVQIREGDW